MQMSTNLWCTLNRNLYTQGYIYIIKDIYIYIEKYNALETKLDRRIFYDTILTITATNKQQTIQ